MNEAAEQGFGEAQAKLGFMYYKGWGITQDDSKAERWYRISAEHGVGEGQLGLGMMYLVGRGVPQDNIQSYKWLSLAVSNNAEKADRFRALAALSMTESEKEQGQSLAQEWRNFNQ
ncbi:MAG: tetratricopeptide repeat protein [Mariprofundaceae bacterium]|nr:tetratricopeptide repeat protein [Mariprofundaceae bacterium]